MKTIKKIVKKTIISLMTAFGVLVTLSFSVILLLQILDNPKNTKYAESMFGHVSWNSVLPFLGGLCVFMGCTMYWVIRKKKRARSSNYSYKDYSCTGDSSSSFDEYKERQRDSTRAETDRLAGIYGKFGPSASEDDYNLANAPYGQTIHGDMRYSKDGKTEYWNGIEWKELND